MVRMNRIVNLVKICVKHKKSTILTKINKKEIRLVQLLIKINIITFAKIIKKNMILVKPNFNFKLNINEFFKKKKISIKSNNKFFKKKITIISTTNGLKIFKKNGGIVL
jgi:hypothetical protein